MIKYIREYYLYTLTMFDIIYTKDGKHTSKILTRSKSLLPETARKYIEYCKEHGKKEEIIRQVRGKIEPEIEIIYDARK